MSAPDVLVVGGCGIDYTVRSERLPSAGTSVTGDRFLRSPGGKGLNQAIAAGRLGARAAFVSAVGDDVAGREVLAALEAAGIATNHVRRAAGKTTARTLICVDARGRKLTASAPGANLALGPGDVPGGLVARARIVLAQLEVQVATVAQAARLARSAGATFVLDAAPATDIPAGLLAMADLVHANGEEAEALSGIEVDGRDSAMAAAREIRRRGARRTAVGISEGRAVVGEDGEERWLPSYAVDVVDTTGAGDASAAAIAVGLAEGLSFLDACSFGHAAAALAATRLGALASLPTRAAVEALLAKRTSEKPLA